MELEDCFPQTVEVAVFVDGNRFVVANEEGSNGFVFEVFKHAAILGFDVDERDVVFGRHWVLDASHVDTDCVVVNLSYYGDVLFLACVDGVGYKFYPRVVVACARSCRVNEFYYYIIRFFAFEKFSCHSLKCYFIVSVFRFLLVEKVL